MTTVPAPFFPRTISTNLQSKLARDDSTFHESAIRDDILKEMDKDSDDEIYVRGDPFKMYRDDPHTRGMIFRNATFYNQMPLSVKDPIKMGRPQTKHYKAPKMTLDNGTGQHIELKLSMSQ